MEYFAYPKTSHLPCQRVAAPAEQLRRFMTPTIGFSKSGKNECAVIAACHRRQVTAVTIGKVALQRC